MTASTLLKRRSKEVAKMKVIDTPTRGAEVAVRCKECKNRYTFDCPMDNETQDNDFCCMWQGEKEKL